MDKDEYGLPRTVGGFIAWVDETMETRLGDASQFRAGEGFWKKFRDEARPLARFLPHYKRIPVTAHVSLATENEAGDARIVWGDGSLTIEIATTQSALDSFEREHLERHGSAPGETTVIRTAADLASWRKKGQPRDPGLVMNVETLRQEELGRFRDRIASKLGKRYPSNTILLVFSDSTSCYHIEDIEICEQAAIALRATAQNPFLDVWVCIRGERAIKCF